MTNEKPFTVFVSVYDKDGLDVFLWELAKANRNVRFISSGGTAEFIRKAGLCVTSVEELTGQRSILDGRVKTLVPQLYGAVLAKDTPGHDADRAAYNIGWIDMGIMGFYPLESEIAKSSSTEESVTEQTDVGGPSFVHACAKGRRLILCKRSQWPEALERLRAGTANDPEYRRRLAATAEYEVAKYLMASARYLSGGGYEAVFGERVRTLKYGENAWQTPAHHYATDGRDPLALHNFKLVEGNPSHTTMTDLDRSLQTLSHIAVALEARGYKEKRIAVGCKHGNACGSSLMHEDTNVAVSNMLLGNLQAIFGGAIILNFPVSGKEAHQLLHFRSEKRRPIDVVAAPSFTDEAIEELHRKEGKCKLFENPALACSTLDMAQRFRYVRGGFLTQPNYMFVLDLSAPYVTKHGAATPDQELDMLLAWAIGSTSNSNKITLVKYCQLIGNGVSQQSRVEAAELALLKVKYSGDVPSGAVAYSDSFFPFPDGPKVLIEAGIRAILTTSGSVRDKETIELCQKSNVPLYMIPDEVGRGFFGH